MDLRLSSSWLKNLALSLKICLMPMLSMVHNIESDATPSVHRPHSVLPMVHRISAHVRL